MDRDIALTVVLAVLAVLALAVAAATLDTAVTTEGGGTGGLGAVDRTGVGGPSDVADTGLRGEAKPGPLFQPLCVPWLEQPPAILAILAGFLVFGYAVYLKTGDVLPPVAMSIAFGMPVFMVWALLTACGVREESGSGLLGAVRFNDTALVSGGGGAPSGSGSALSTPSALFGVLLVLALVGAAVLLVVGTGSDEPDPEPETEPAEADVDVTAIGRAAGEAADRIEADADVDNEVYRAWREMTTLLDVENPRSSTPAEFAAAAVDAGLERDDVDELTSLFEAVRYGGATPTADREERAVAALRRVEATYGDGETGVDVGNGRGDTDERGDRR